uniref:Uncharacterized protein n=1 Tax=Amorphochlora amoebiformis TaxID=1561963 RepID=A0A7S0DHG1_9EUKA
MARQMKIPPRLAGDYPVSNKEGSRCRMNQLISIGLAVSVTIVAVVYNSKLLSQAPYPYLVTLAQLLVIFVGTQVPRYTTTLFTSTNSTAGMSWWRYLWSVLMISILLASHMYLANIALMRLPISLIRMLNATQLIWFVLGMVLFGYEGSARSAGVHVAVTTAALLLICISSASHSDMKGLASQLGSNILFSLEILLAGTCLSDETTPNSNMNASLTLPGVMYHAAPWAALMMGIMWCTLESYTSDWEVIYSVGLPAFLFNGILTFAAMITVSSVSFTTSLPVITLSSIGSDAGVFIIASLLLNERLHWGSLIAVSLAWGSNFLFRRARERLVPGQRQPGIEGSSRGEWIPQARVPDLLNTGDIVLFTSVPALSMKGIGSAAVRLATFSTYDHVALVIKTQMNETFLIEALAEGVSVNEWHNFQDQDWHEEYCRISLRRLNWNKSGTGVSSRGSIVQRAALEEFADGVRGKKYGLNLCGLLCGCGVGEWNDAKRTYFCSELVGEGFKFIGLLPSKICTAQLVPGDFAEGKHLKLPEGASFGPEMKVHFDGRWEGFETATEFVLRSF